MFGNHKKGMYAMSATTPLKTYFAPAERASKEEVRQAWQKVLEAGLVSSVLDIMPDPAVILNVQRQIVAINRQMVKEMGFSSREEALGCRPGELFGCYEASHAPNGCGTGTGCRYCGLLGTVLKANQPNMETEGECSIRLESGKAMDYYVLAATREIDDLSVVFVGLRDLSAEKRRKMLERTFFHDILNTAGGIKGFMALLGEDELHEPDRNYKAAIKELSGVLVEEIHSYRQLIQAEDDTLVLHETTISSRKLLKNLQLLYQNHVVGKGKTIRILPFEDRRLFTDLSLLRRILANMLKNALEAIKDGEEVTLDVRDSPDFVEFRVANPGVIPEKVRAQVFHRSFSTKGADRGLGTYSMKLLGERYLGGEVFFESTPETGTVFCFRLQGTTKNGSDHETLIPDTSETTQQTENLTGLRVLLADDDHFSRKICTIMLKKLGCEVDEVENGLQALERLKTESFDFVLLDVHMPIMDGLQAARAIREKLQDPNTPILAITAGTLEEDRISCLQAGMNDFIDKPVDSDDLGRTLLKWRGWMA